MAPGFTPNDPRIGCPVNDCHSEPCTCPEAPPCPTESPQITSTTRFPPWRTIPADCYADDCHRWFREVCGLREFRILFPYIFAVYDAYNNTVPTTSTVSTEQRIDCTPRVIHIREKYFIFYIMFFSYFHFTSMHL